MSIGLSKFKTQLLAMQDDLIGVNQKLENSAKPVTLDQNSVGRLSRMDALQGQAMAQASAERQKQQLDAIARALQRIEHGTYGRCTECDEFIAEARLVTNPTAHYCIECAVAMESV